MKEFSLDGHEYIELNKLIKIMRLAGSGGEANQLIDDGEIMVNGETENRRRRKMRAGDECTFHGQIVRVKE